MEDENVSLRRIFHFHRLTKVLLEHLRTSVEIPRGLNVSPFVFVGISTIDDLQVFDRRRIDILQKLNHLEQRGCEVNERERERTYGFGMDTSEIGMFTTLAAREEIGR